MNTLYIDTRNNNNIIIRLKTNKEEFVEQSKANNKKVQTALLLVEKLFKKAKITPKEIEEIKVEKDNGSFTGLRVGITIANTLSFGTLVRVNGKELGEIEMPEYK